MITYDDNNVVGEINTSYTSDGKVITTNTAYYNGRPVAQTISVRDSQGRVETTNILGGKVLPPVHTGTERCASQGRTCSSRTSSAQPVVKSNSYRNRSPSCKPEPGKRDLPGIPIEGNATTLWHPIVPSMKAEEVKMSHRSSRRPVGEVHGVGRCWFRQGSIGAARSGD
jgi:hypothetical protein